MSKQIIVCIAFGLLCLLPASAFAEKGDVNVGYVDLQAALSKSKLGADAQKDYEAKVKKAQSSLDDKKSEYERLRGKFVKQKDSLSTSARQEREEKLIAMEKDLKRTFQDTRESLRRENAKIVSGLVSKLRKVVSEIGEKEGFTVILEKGGQSVLYADSSIDITDSVIKEFDSRF